ncbi:hypothetical protein CAOG_01048, partial [Capsaspora owczarzaki ATCC 30864]
VSSGCALGCYGAPHATRRRTVLSENTRRSGVPNPNLSQLSPKRSILNKAKTTPPKSKVVGDLRRDAAEAAAAAAAKQRNPATGGTARRTQVESTSERNSASDSIAEPQAVPPRHHIKIPVCTTRPEYREGRRETAVKVYTIADESKFLLLLRVPALKLEQQLCDLVTAQGQVESLRRLDEYPCDQFQEAFLAKFTQLPVARAAKRQLDGHVFFGTPLHVCYAPEYETLADLREKFDERRRAVTARLNAQAQPAPNPAASLTAPWQPTWLDWRWPAFPQYPSTDPPHAIHHQLMSAQQVSAGRRPIPGPTTLPPDDATRNPIAALLPRRDPTHLHTAPPKVSVNSRSHSSSLAQSLDPSSVPPLRPAPKSESLQPVQQAPTAIPSKRPAESEADASTSTLSSENPAVNAPTAVRKRRRI